MVVHFLAALGFATAATTLILIERFGTIAACWIVAGGFTLVGLGATLVVAVKEQVAKEAEAADTAEILTAAAQTPLALLRAILATLVGPSTIAGAVNVVAQNIPLVVLLALLALLFWLTEVEKDEAHVGGTKGTRWPRAQRFAPRDIGLKLPADDARKLSSFACRRKVSGRDRNQRLHVSVDGEEGVEAVRDPLLKSNAIDLSLLGKLPCRTVSGQVSNRCPRLAATLRSISSAVVPMPPGL